MPVGCIFQRERVLCGLMISETEARPLINFCDDRSFCNRADIILRQVLDITVDEYSQQPTEPKQEIYQKMIKNKEAVVEDGHAHLTSTGDSSKLIRKYRPEIDVTGE